MITQQEIQGNWNQLKGAIKEKWGQLTDEDITRAKGNVDQLVGMIQQRTGESKARVEAFFDEAMKSGASRIERATEKLREYTNEFGNVAHQRYEDAAEAVSDGLSSAQETVRRHPSESVAVCFGAGLIAGTIIGLLLRSRD